MCAEVDGCVCVFVCVHHTCARHPQSSEEGVKPSGTRIGEDCELSCECWESLVLSR